MPSNDMVILPNSKLTQSVLVNYHLPDPRRGISIGVSVPHHADPDMIERMLLDETLKAVGTVPGLLAEPAPSVRFIPGFGENRPETFQSTVTSASSLIMDWSSTNSASES